jgi:hypothetical protein
MFTILGADGKEYGPVPAGKVQEWISGGRANLQTKARRVEETEWKTLGDFPEFSAPPPPPTGPTLAPGSAADSIARPAIPDDPKIYANQLIARAAPLDVFGCLGRSFELWKTNLLPLVGVTFVIFLIAGILGAIPFIGFLCNLVLTGVFYGGLYYYYLGKMRGEPREFGDAFSGFSKAFGPLALATLFTVLITGFAALLLLCPWFLAFGLMSGGHMSQHLGIITVPGIFLCCLPLIYITVAWSFTFPLVIDQGLSPWTAMEVSRRVVTKQWFRVFFTALLGGILAMLGLIGLIIGVIFTLPLAVGAIMYAYEDLCNPPAPAGTPAATDTPTAPTLQA